MEERSWRFSHRNPICGDTAQSQTPNDCLNFPSAFPLDAVSECLKTLFYILQFVLLVRGLTKGDTLLFPGLWVWTPSGCHNSASLVASAWCLSAPSGEITFLLLLFLLLESFTGGDSLYLQVQLTSSKERPGSLYTGCSEHSTVLLSISYYSPQCWLVAVTQNLPIWNQNYVRHRSSSMLYNKRVFAEGSSARVRHLVRTVLIPREISTPVPQSPHRTFLWTHIQSRALPSFAFQILW